MRVCFIGDCGSIHLRRMVVYFSRDGHNTFLLSTASQKTEIQGVTIAYAILSETEAEVSEKGNSEQERRSVLRRYIARKVKEEYKLIMRSFVNLMRLLLQRKQSLRRINEFSPKVFVVWRAFPE